MGSEHSKFLNQQQLPSEYKPLLELPHVYESIINGTRIQKHKLRLTSEKEINYEKEIFIFRRMNADRVITANYFDNFVNENMCHAAYEVCFFTEYPAYGMSMNLIMCSERSFNLLIECLKGFEVLYKKFGAFKINCENIFFDSHHEAKVWISSDLGKTSIDVRFETGVTEQTMILNLFSIFDQIQNKKSVSTNYSNYLNKFQTKNPKNLTFSKIIEFMVEEASKYFMTRIDSIHSRNQIFLESSQVLKRYSKKLNPTGKPKFDSVSTPNRKESNQNIISLKNRSKNNSKYEQNEDEEFDGINKCVKFLETPKGSKFKEQREAKREKRWNSQEDCFFQKEIYGYETPNNRKNIHEKENIKDNLHQEYKHYEKYSPSFTKDTNFSKPSHRNIRRSMEEFESVSNEFYEIKSIKFNESKFSTIIYEKSPLHEVNINKGIKEREYQREPMQESRETQKTINFSYQAPSQKKYRCDHKIYSTSSVATENDNIIPEGSPINMWKDPMILKKLQTMKSIFEGEAFDIDDQIMRDLEKYRIL